MSLQEKSRLMERRLLKDNNRKWYLLELNQGHMDFQSIALPPELRHLLRSDALCKHPKSECKGSDFVRLPQIFPPKFAAE